jgi:hypothetical protein
MNANTKKSARFAAHMHTHVHSIMSKNRSGGHVCAWPCACMCARAMHAQPCVSAKSKKLLVSAACVFLKTCVMLMLVCVLAAKGEPF